MNNSENIKNFHLLKVKEFHETFGLKVLENLEEEIINDEKLMNFRISLNEEEYNELCRAYEDEDIIEIIDAIGDLLYVTYGFCISIGFNPDEKLKSKAKYYMVERHNIFSDTFFTECKEKLKNYIDDLSDILQLIKLSVTTKNFNKLLNSLAKFLIKLYAISMFLDLDINLVFNLIHKSNMSKSCKDEKEAKDTVLDYIEKYEKNNSPYDSPSYKISDNKKYWIVYNKSTSKILKSINYKPVDLTQLFFA